MQAPAGDYRKGYTSSDGKIVMYSDDRWTFLEELVHRYQYRENPTQLRGEREMEAKFFIIDYCNSEKVSHYIMGNARDWDAIELFKNNPSQETYDEAKDALTRMGYMNNYPLTKNYDDFKTPNYNSLTNKK